MKYSKYKIFNLTVIIAVCLGLYSCNDLPTDMGYTMMLDTFAVESINSENGNLNITHKNYHFHQATRINSGKMLLGSAGDAKAAAFINFGYPPDDPRDSNMKEILNAKLIFNYDNYIFGDTNNPYLKFNIYPVKKIWTNVETWKDFFTAPADYIDYSVKLGEKEITFKNDSVYSKRDTVIIDKEIVVNYFKHSNEALGYYADIRIALVPDESSNCIRRLTTTRITDVDSVKFKNRTYIYYDYVGLDTAGVNDSVRTKWIDADMEMSVCNDAPAEENDLILQGAYEHDTRMYFNLTNMPDNIDIYSSELELTLDISKTKTAYNIQTNGESNIINHAVSAFYIKRENLDSIAAGDTVVIGAGKAVAYDANTNTYKFTIIMNTGIKQWINLEDKTGNIMLVMGNTDNKLNKIDRLYFHNVFDPDPKKRPRLRVLYAKRPYYYDMKNR